MGAWLAREGPIRYGQGLTRAMQDGTSPVDPGRGQAQGQSRVVG
jgi:hypothetical protein